MLRRMATVVAATTALALGAAAPALATELDPIPWTGQGANEDGTCESFENDDDKVDVPAGKQAWHFILTGQGDPEGATMDADFDDGTSVTGVSPTFVAGPVAHFYAITDLGAKIISATAYPAGEQGANPQFVVSHCVEGEKPPETTPPVTTPPVTTPPATEPPTEKPDDKETPKPDDKETPKPVPTSVPAGYGDADNGSAGTIGLLAFATALAVGGAALVSRRFLKDN